MPQVEVDPNQTSASELRRSPVFDSGYWQQPEWLVKSNAEVQRLSALTDEERKREWDALSPEAQAAYNEAFDRAISEIDNRQRVRRGLA